MSASAQPGGWPADPGHRDAIEMLLDMASAEDRWGDHRRAVHLLNRVEEILGELPLEYERIRTWRTRGPARLPTGA